MRPRWLQSGRQQAPCAGRVGRAGCMRERGSAERPRWPITSRERPHLRSRCPSAAIVRRARPANALPSPLPRNRCAASTASIRAICSSSRWQGSGAGSITTCKPDPLLGGP